MAYAGSSISTGIGLRYVYVTERDTDNMPSVPAGTAIGTAYPGLRIGGALALTITIPDPQRVAARGDDRTYHTFQLPPTDSPSGELRVSKTAMNVIALLSNVLVFGSGTQKKIGFASAQQGLEPALILWGSRQAIDSDDDSIYFGQQVWQTYILLNALASPRPASMEDSTVGEFMYSIVANDAGVDELGGTFTAGVHGFTRAPYLMVVTKGKFGLDTFVGDSAEVDFVLSNTPSSDSNTIVAVDGVVQTLTTEYTVLTNTVTFDSAPGTDAKIVIEYEW